MEKIIYIPKSLKGFIMSEHYVYMLRCKDDTLYTGYTTDIERRLQMHTSGKGAKYTKGRGPFILEWTEKYETKSEAMQREYALKRLSRLEKEQFIEERRKMDNEPTKKF